MDLSSHSKDLSEMAVAMGHLNKGTYKHTGWDRNIIDFHMDSFSC